MDFNFSKLDLSQNVEIFLYSKLSNDFSQRSAFGIQVRTGIKNAFLTERLEYETENVDVFVIEKMFELLKELTNNNEIFQRQIDIHSEFNFISYINDPTLYEYSYLRDRLNSIRVELHRYEVTGYVFEFFAEKTTSILEERVNLALETYFIINDFLNRREFLSVISSSSFDKLFYDTLLPKGSQIIQYVDKFTNQSISGPEKRILRPLDGAAGDSLIISIDTTERFPSGNERKNFLIRRMSISLIQSNVAILFSTVDENNIILSPDVWFYDMAKKLDIPFYFYDCVLKVWYTPSKDKDNNREWIHVKNFKITQKQVAYYINQEYYKDALIEWKKLLNKNFI